MRNSPQSPAGSVSSGSSPTLLHPAWKPSPRTTITARPRNNSDSYPNNNNINNNDDDLIDEDIFGSAAWRKKRGTKRGGKIPIHEQNGGARGDRKTARNVGKSALRALGRILGQGSEGLKARVLTVTSWAGGAWSWVTPSPRSETSRSAAGARAGVGGGSGNSDVAGDAMSDCMSGSDPHPAAEPGSYELTSEVLVQQARLLCGNYIYHRLSSKGLMTKRVHVVPYHSLVSEELNCAGQELEKLYPKVYSDVSRRIAMTMSSAQLVRRLLTSVMEATFRSGVTWAKVVSMVVISAAFAEECVVQGHPGYVEDVVMCVGHYVTLHLTGWLAKHGGWAGFPTSRPPLLKQPSDGSPAMLRSALALILLALLLLGLTKLVLGTSS